ncbi:MAG: hypothetical protein H7A25_13810 [Leptospiraceae bacterium]|nr:hypothetical protein [Leptospiraceae bacterium]
MSLKKLFSILIILIFFGSLISQEKELSKEDLRRAVLIEEYYSFLRANRPNEALKFASVYFKID